MRRRDFVAGAAAATAWEGISRAATMLGDIPIIDAHMHLFDATRPQGAPYTGSRAYQGGVSLPPLYRAVARPAGIVGAVAIEASRWIEDNLWLLERVESDPFMVAMIGDLEPVAPEFAEYLDRYRKNRLFRGIRYGNLWGYDLVAQAGNPAFIDGLKRLAAADLVLDTANPRLDLFEAVIRISDQVPALRIIVDHMQRPDPKPQEQATYQALLKEMGSRPGIFAKISQLDTRVNGEMIRGPAARHDKMDLLTGTFGEDRVIFCSNWPGSVGEATIPEIIAFAKAYYADKPRAAAEKFFWKNSRAAYKWTQRAADQPG